MNKNTLLFGGEDHLLVLVGQLCNCAKFGKDQLLKSKCNAVSSSSVKKALSMKDSGSEVFKFELGENIPAVVLTIDYSKHCIDVSSYNKVFGIESSSQAKANAEWMMARPNVKIEYLQDLPSDGFITREEVSK